jgi:hypothetical protein
VLPHVDTRVPRQVEREVVSIYRKLYPSGDVAAVVRAFDWATLCFEGRHPDYQRIDAGYHDFEHTLQGALCLVRLIQGRARAGATPAVTAEWFVLALLAALFHDSGYLKRKGDEAGTGAKYTATHVARGAQFAREFLATQGVKAADLDAIANMIRCTGVNANLGAIPFRHDVERVLGRALATADLIGQMAAPDYVEKLPVLFQEFVEAAQFDADQGMRFACFTSAEDLARRTPDFWERYVRPRLEKDFEGLYRFLADPYPDGPNPYVQRIEENVARIRRKFSA